MPAQSGSLRCRLVFSVQADEPSQPSGRYDRARLRPHAGLLDGQKPNRLRRLSWRCQEADKESPLGGLSRQAV
jgi:hypothetical protein